MSKKMNAKARSELNEDIKHVNRLIRERRLFLKPVNLLPMPDDDLAAASEPETEAETETETEPDTGDEVVW